MDYEKHNNTKLPITIETFRFLFEDWTDNQRLEVIRSLIWTAPDMTSFHDKVVTELTSKKFSSSLD